jgi:hypothetical protein
MKYRLSVRLLSALGGALLWTACGFCQSLLVPAGSVWKYLDDGSNQGAAWRTTNFNDTTWPAGLAELGYGDASEGRPERTVIGFGTNANSKYITCYFRHVFPVAAPGVFTNLLLGLMRDDGAIVYLNGSEVCRNNMPGGAVSYATLASSSVSGGDEATFYQTNLSPALLRPGTNVLAVEVHQNSGSSSDVSFDLFLAGFTGTTSTNRLFFYVATNGNDNWTGAAPQPTGSDGPFATLERARDVLRFYTQNGFLPPGGAVVEIRGGAYPLARSFDLTSSDTGTPQSPIVWRARQNEEVRIVGGRVLGGFARVTDSVVLARLDPTARGKVWQTDLRAQGVTNFAPPQAGTSWAQSDPGLEFFFQDKPMTLARWPNEGYVKIVKALGPTPVNVRGTVGTVEGIFSCAGDRPTRWTGEVDIMLHGFWFWDWADQRHKVLSIDTVSNIITVATPYHTYGYRDGQWFYAYNLLPEIDQPGEWYLDRQSGMLYFWPPAPIDQGRAMVSLIPNLVTVTNASHITLQGFIFEGSQNTGLSISGGASNCVKACTVRNIGKTGVRVVNSPGSGVTGCDIYFTGDGGVTLSGGDRPTLTPAGLYADHNHIHHYARWNPVYKPGISLSGVGHRAAHNLVHDAPHEGIAFGGNDHLIEFNEFHTVVNESNDAGVIYAGRTWTARGHVIRYNYFHHIYGLERRGCNGVYLDDQFSSARVYGNVFFEVPTAVLLGGGRDNFVENNVFIQCQTAISLDARGLGWASNGFGGLSNELVSLPYQNPPWSVCYPELTNILNEDPMAPRGNVFARNLSWAGGWTRIETLAQPGVTLSNNLVNIDPRCVDTNRWNFQLQDDSPAFALGFERLPLDLIGPQTNVEHAPWPPSVTLVRPLHHAVVGFPASVVLEAIVSDPGRLADKIEFLVGTAILGETAEFPYRFTWSNAPPGSYTLNARAVYGEVTTGTLRPVVIQVDDTLVAAGSTWKYLDNGSNPGTVWRGTNFNDSPWKSGPAQLGYGDGDEATVIGYGPNASSKYITSYLRRSFVVTPSSRYTNLVLGILRDDGAVVYLNGDEIWRSNMPTGVVAYTTLALAALSDETTFHQTNLSPALLRAGTNVLAVEIHQVNGQSSDVSFDLFLHGQSSGAEVIVRAQRAGGGLELSWPVGAADWVLEATPTLPSSAWPELARPASVKDDRVTASVEASDGSRFFRLSKP